MAHPDATVHRDTAERGPSVERVHHICLAVRDLDQARRFWVDVLGGEPLRPGRERVAKLRLGDVTVILTQAGSGWTLPTAEYPHYGFRYAPEDMAPMRDRLRAFGLPTGEIWTRHQVEGLMYFRDPAGNLLELACWHGLEGADRLPLSVQTGGDHATDLGALSYPWSAVGSPSGERTVQPTQLDHLSLPARDMAETGRFWVEVLGARWGRSPSHMVEIGGIDVSFSAVSGGWTARDSALPRYAFSVAPEHLLPLKMRLESFGIPTHDVCTHNGSDAWMYFRDPSGNLFELYCERGFTGPIRGVQAGADSTVDVASLCYDRWSDPGR